MVKEKKVIGAGVKVKALTAEEKKRKEEKEKREKEKERKERKAQLASDRTFGLKNKNVSAKVQSKIEELKRDAPTKDAERAKAEAKARERKKQKEAEEEAKRELEILMGVRSSIPQKKKFVQQDVDALAEDVGGLSVKTEAPKNYVIHRKEESEEEEEEKRELTEEERKAIIAKIESEKAKAKEAELKEMGNVDPFYVADEDWQGDDPFDLLTQIAGNKRAIFMPKDSPAQPMETA